MLIHRISITEPIFSISETYNEDAFFGLILNELDAHQFTGEVKSLSAGDFDTAEIEELEKSYGASIKTDSLE